MSISTFIFVRHGQSQANADGIIATPDSPLTDLGIEQAKETGRKLRDFKISTILCSPFTRAQQTAATIASEIGIDTKNIETLEDLRERALGDSQGKPKKHESEWYSQSDDPSLEKRQDILDRMHRVIHHIETTFDDEVILVVGHAVSGYYLVEAAKGVKKVADLNKDSQLSNADYLEVTIAQ